jgi:ribosomal-protein-alanine N-acetyltransferase
MKFFIEKIPLSDSKHLREIIQIDQIQMQYSWSQSSWNELLERDCSDYCLLALFSEEELLGFSLFTLYGPYYDEAHLLKIAVKKGLEGRAIATNLLEYFINSSNKLKMIHLEVEQQNIRAIDFYERHGFKKEFLKKAYYSDKSNAWLMIKKLY